MQSLSKIFHASDEYCRYQAEVQKKFLNLLSQLDQYNQPSERPYDVIVAYSGGKDSSYTLKILKDDYKLRTLAITFDHGFLSPQALKNIRIVTEALHVDHLAFSPSRTTLKNVFKKSLKNDLYALKALERASSVCNTCMNLAKSFILRAAIEMAVPFIAYGWSPGQSQIQSSVMKLNISMIRRMQSIMVQTRQQVMGDDINNFTLQERHFRLLANGCSIFPNGSLYNLHPLAFLGYDEARSIKEIEPLGWKFPKDTDANSTNCLLNAFACQVHLEKFGFHPYALEIAGLVREKYITREMGLRKLSSLADKEIISTVKKKLGFK